MREPERAQMPATGQQRQQAAQAPEQVQPALPPARQQGVSLREPVQAREQPALPPAAAGGVAAGVLAGAFAAAVVAGGAATGLAGPCCPRAIRSPPKTVLNTRAERTKSREQDGWHIAGPLGEGD